MAMPLRTPAATAILAVLERELKLALTPWVLERRSAMVELPLGEGLVVCAMWCVEGIAYDAILMLCQSPVVSP